MIVLVLTGPSDVGGVSSHWPAPNNGMHPTRISKNVIQQLGCLIHWVRAGDAGR